MTEVSRQLKRLLSTRGEREREHEEVGWARVEVQGLVERVQVNERLRVSLDIRGLLRAHCGESRPELGHPGAPDELEAFSPDLIGRGEVPPHMNGVGKVRILS